MSRAAPSKPWKPWMAIVSAALALTSCVSFKREWQQALNEYEQDGSEPLTGPWEGHWKTDSNGHTGKLRAIVAPSETNPEAYQFRYHATWAKIFAGSYRVAYPVEQQGGKYLVEGEEDLGIFGIFGHRAVIERDRFDATYSSKRGEIGTFHLTRPSS